MERIKQVEDIISLGSSARLPSCTFQEIRKLLSTS